MSAHGVIHGSIVARILGILGVAAASGLVVDSAWAACPDKTYYVGPRWFCDPGCDLSSSCPCDGGEAVASMILGDLTDCRYISMKVWGGGSKASPDACLVANPPRSAGGGGYVKVDFDLEPNQQWPEGFTLQAVRGGLGDHGGRASYVRNQPATTVYAMGGGGGKAACSVVDGTWFGHDGGGGGGLKGEDAVSYAMGGGGGTETTSGAGGTASDPPGGSGCAGGNGQAATGYGPVDGGQPGVGCSNSVSYGGYGGQGYTGGGGGGFASGTGGTWGAAGGGGANFRASSFSGGGVRIHSYSENGSAPYAANPNDPDRCQGPDPACHAGDGGTEADPAVAGMVVVRLSATPRPIYDIGGCYTWTVPSFLPSGAIVTIKAWGGGGARHTRGGTGGGGGAQVVDVSVEPDEELTVYVGHGGTWSTGTTIEGGEASFVSRESTPLIVAAGGGAAGLSGAAGGAGTGWNGQNGGYHPAGSSGGEGGTGQSGGKGGVGSSNGQEGASIFASGPCLGIDLNPADGGAGGATESAQGGGGYYGGGGGAAGSTGVSGAGAGSSYGESVSLLMTGVGPEPGNRYDFDYMAPAGHGATDTQPARDGLVVILY